MLSKSRQKLISYCFTWLKIYIFETYNLIIKRECILLLMAPSKVHYFINNASIQTYSTFNKQKESTIFIVHNKFTAMQNFSFEEGFKLIYL